MSLSGSDDDLEISLSPVAIDTVDMEGFSNTTAGTLHEDIPDSLISLIIVVGIISVIIIVTTLCIVRNPSKSKCVNWRKYTSLSLQALSPTAEDQSNDGEGTSSSGSGVFLERKNGNFSSKSTFASDFLSDSPELTTKQNGSQGSDSNYYTELDYEDDVRENVHSEARRMFLPSMSSESPSQLCYERKQLQPMTSVKSNSHYKSGGSQDSDNCSIIGFQDNVSKETVTNEADGNPIGSFNKGSISAEPTCDFHILEGNTPATEASRIQSLSDFCQSAVYSDDYVQPQACQTRSIMEVGKLMSGGKRYSPPKYCNTSRLGLFGAHHSTQVRKLNQYGVLLLPLRESSAGTDTFSSNDDFQQEVAQLSISSSLSAPLMPWRCHDTNEQRHALKSLADTRGTNTAFDDDIFPPSNDTWENDICVRRNPRTDTALESLLTKQQSDTFSDDQDIAPEKLFQAQQLPHDRLGNLDPARVNENREDDRATAAIGFPHHTQHYTWVRDYCQIENNVPLSSYASYTLVPRGEKLCTPKRCPHYLPEEEYGKPVLPSTARRIVPPIQPEQDPELDEEGYVVMRNPNVKK